MLVLKSSLVKRCYSELVKISTFEGRFDYLKTIGPLAGEETFGINRFLNQDLYRSKPWKQLRHRIIIRDNACDLAMPGYELYGNIRIHHMNPISVEMLNNHDPDVLNEEYLVCTSFDTHNALHFGYLTGEQYTSKWKLVERKPNDTIPWR